MEKVIKKYNRNSLKYSFISMVIFTVTIILISSALSVYLCMYLQKGILPEGNTVWLSVETKYSDGSIRETKQQMAFNNKVELSELHSSETNSEEVMDTSYIVEKIENNLATLTLKKKLSYRILTIAMVVFPIVYSLIGVTLCAWRFYRKKLEPPLLILSEATQNISNQNLDFVVDYDNNDEMGQLCYAFEQMREALYQNNQKLWEMMEEQKELHASVARSYVTRVDKNTDTAQLTIAGSIQNKLGETLVSKQTIYSSRGATNFSGSWTSIPSNAYALDGTHGVQGGSKYAAAAVYTYTRVN